MKAILFLLILISSSSFAESKLDYVKGVFSLSICLYNKTPTMCLVEDMLNKYSSEPASPDVEIFGKSKKYYLASRSSNWLKADLSDDKKTDLLLIDSQAMGFIETNFKEGQSHSINQLAKAPLIEMAKKLQSKPEKIEADFWPWVDNGAIYQICYYTDQETVECMISAAANILGGHVTLYSLSTNINSVTDSAVQIIASMDVPKE